MNAVEDLQPLVLSSSVEEVTRSARRSQKVRSVVVTDREWSGICRNRKKAKARRRRKRMLRAIWSMVKPYVIKATMLLGNALLAAAFAALIVWMLFFADDGYRAPMPEPEMVKAIDGDYYYSAEDYDQYLKERQAYIDDEKKMQEAFIHDAGN